MLEEEEGEVCRGERERENSVARLLCEVVGQLLVVEMVVVKSVVRVLVAEGHGGEREREFMVAAEMGGKANFPFFGHEIHSYL